MALTRKKNISTLNKELNQFLTSDSDELPQSLKQFSKLATSNEFTISLTKASESVFIGILQGHKLDMKKKNQSDVGIENATRECNLK
ncbi:hypothetical protein TanjilG_06904 [Lupinus angustifolius]|uniref:Uncharacterized protein n=1 Tax=Lupinus angustifolius TaxID=3871 RepID=A0A4P1QV35_LUPAN|nr:hypothetical protein TanjilG_06904 [Lupinus angustifolius]